MWWKEPVTTLKGVGVKKAAELAALNIFSVGDLLEFYPRQGAYLDYAKLKTIKELDVDNSKQIFKATVYQVKNGYGASRRSYTSVTVRDETGYATLYFFGGQRYKAQKLKPDTVLQITGRVRQGRTTKSVSEVDVQPLEQDEGKTPGIVPVYALSGNLTQKNLRTWISEALRLAAGFAGKPAGEGCESIQFARPLYGAEKYSLPGKLGSVATCQAALCF